MYNDVDKYVASCEICQKNNPKIKKTVPSLHPIPVPSEAWKQVSNFKQSTDFDFRIGSSVASIQDG